MSRSGLVTVIGVLLVMGGLAVAVVFSQDSVPSLPETISGVVIDSSGPAAGAIVQLQGTPNRTETGPDGTFTLSGIEGTAPALVTAWSAGHYIGWTTLDPELPVWENGDIQITLNPLPQVDNHEYNWFSAEGVSGSAGCGLCHREYEEWRADQHAQSAVNHRFLTMYTGRDVHGEIGQPIQYGSNGLPLPPDPDLPYTGPGFVPDNPGGRAGNCTTCHVPMVSRLPNDQNCSWSGCHTSLTIERAGTFLAMPGTPLSARGPALEGISCEFCHKIGDVIIDPETNLPMPDMPGILSVRLYRPMTEDDQVFFGNLVDVKGQDSYLPLISESRFCASCHFGVFGGVMGVGTMTGGIAVYNSYGEWLDSPYSDPDTGQTCQDCHMPASEHNWFVYEERGGITRDYAVLHNHTMTGPSSGDLLQNSVTMESSARRDGDQLQVEVSITNDKTGHHVPTDQVMRSMILVVEALDANNRPLELRAGPVNPEFSGDYGGLPGKTFALVLRDKWTGEAPTTAFWREIELVEDTRLAALATDTTSYTFVAPADTAITVNVRLLYRRAFYDLMQQKGWDDPDIVMEHETLHVPAS
jgi:hypothetical protein